jgi:hypothetical protein
MAGIGLLAQGALALCSTLPVEPVLMNVLTIGIGLLLLVGLRTPVAGTMLGILALWHAFLHVPDPWMFAFMGTLGVALALLGPGVSSVDARLFGWKRIRISDR